MNEDGTVTKWQLEADLDYLNNMGKELINFAEIKGKRLVAKFVKIGG